MPLTKPNQELQGDLKATASSLEDAANVLFQQAKCLSEAETPAAMAQVARLYGHAELMKAYADEVSEGKVNRDGALPAVSDR